MNDRATYKKNWIAAKRLLGKRKADGNPSNPRGAVASGGTCQQACPNVDCSRTIAATDDVTSLENRIELSSDDGSKSDAALLPDSKNLALGFDVNGCSCCSDTRLTLSPEYSAFSPYDAPLPTLFSSSSSDSESEGSDILGDLKSWACEFQVKQNALDKLLKLLQRHGHQELPSTARTILKTPQDIPIQDKSGLQYVYFGFGKSLAAVLERHFSTAGDTSMREFDISLNIDGLPLFKSRKNSLWPILCSVHLRPYTVFPISLSYGISKPKDLDFCLDAVHELNELLANGFVFNGICFKVNLRCIVCDAPARAMVKCVKLFSGYSGCDRCCQPGYWIGRMTYPQVCNLSLRTDGTFRNQSDKRHHRGISPFCNLPLDMVHGFPQDYMHLVCLGVTRKLLLLWTKGPKKCRISAGQIAQISSHLKSLRTFMPANFARKPRDLEELEFWKATEFRQFILYTGKIVLKGILRDELYQHFLTLSVAISLLVNEKTASDHGAYAKSLLEYFVDHAQRLYGPEILVYNVHSLLHLAADVEKYGCLENFSAFQFENYMQSIKRMVRSGRNPLAQIVKRYKEQEDELLRVPVVGPLQCEISPKAPNNAFDLDGHCCVVVSRCLDSSDEMYLCTCFPRTRPLFEHPCNSSLIGAFKVDVNYSDTKIVPRNALNKKGIFIKGKKNIFLRLLHNIAT